MIVVRLVDSPDLEGWLTRSRKRRKRRWRAYKARRRERLRRVRRRWRHFWRDWWHTIATVIHRIGTLVVSWFVPVLGKYVGQLGQKYIDAARNAQLRIQQGKALGHAGLEIFKSYIEAAPDGAVGVLQRISSKYGPEFVVPPDLQGPMQALLNHSSVQKIVALEDKLDDLAEGSKEAATLQAQIDYLEEGPNGVLDDLVALEQALDDAYWTQFPPMHKAHPKGSPKYRKYKTLDAAKWGQHVDVWVSRKGDLWTRWKEEDRGHEPENTEVGIWYRVTGDPAFAVIAEVTPEFKEAAAATEAARAALLQEAQNEQGYMTRMGIAAPTGIVPVPSTKKGIPGWGWALIAAGSVGLLGAILYVATRED